jgi:hypothetical protein
VMKNPRIVRKNYRTVSMEVSKVGSNDEVLKVR